MALSATHKRHLKAVLAYEERYQKSLWAGRDGTKTKTLDQLTDRGLLLRQRDEHHTRFLYSLTPAGRRALEDAV